jgi:sigma-B regulation protein RsbU (phosphoserine phosphatase)
VILAYATQTLLQGSPVTHFPPAASLFLGIVLAVAAAFIALGRKLALDVVLILSLLLGLLALGIALAALRLTILPAGLIVSVTLASAVVGLFVNYIHTRFTAQEQGRELEEISSDLKKAAEIQHSLQPESMPSLEGAQIAGFQVACKEIGGDYYDVIELADGKVGLLVADVCGKGISAALLMSNLQSNFRQMAPRTASPRQLVTDLNAVAARVFSDGRFVTLFYAILDLRTRQFTYSNAGHMPPLICRADGEVVGLELGGLPIGLFPQFLWEDHSTILRSGDVVFVYTDGLSEAAAPKADELFGEQRIKDFLRDNHGDSADGLNRGIVKAARIFSGSEHLDDDITLLTLKVV